MMEIALSPYKPLSGKKAKKGHSSSIPPQVSMVSLLSTEAEEEWTVQQVGEAVKALLVDSKAALKSLAAQAASFASEDKLCPSGILINALEANGFTELVRPFT
jgi:hypothetical protein